MAMMETSMFSEIHDPADRVRKLCQYGCEVDVDGNIPAKRYFRSGLEMIRMANVYHDENNYESAFVLYSKFITLFIEKLPKHPDYKSVPAKDREVNKKKLRIVLSLAEEIKKRLKETYTKEEKKRQEEEKKRQAELAREQERRRQEEEERRKLIAEQRLEDEKKWLEEEDRLQHEQERELQWLQEQERNRINAAEEAEAAAALAQAQAAMGALGINNASAFPPDGAFPAPPSYSTVVSPEGITAAPSVPDRSLKPSAPPTSPLPDVNRSLKPTDHFTSTGVGGTSTNKYGLRDVVVPAELMVKFLNLAMANTTNNIETCGILCGTMARDAFRITHLVLPKQSGTPDSCTTECEEELFDVQDKYDLITLGWIHTHPTQTAFLSSVDLHTHCSYQLMLPEAVAIVCSPKYQETGFFSVTPHHGLKFISSCKRTGFHEHPKEPPLFENSSHVKVDQNSQVMTVDLRR